MEPPHEQLVWQGTPSQWSNFRFFVLSILFCWLIIPVILMIHRWLVTRSMRMTLTTERLRMEWGVVSRRLEEVELYRVRDSAVTQTPIERMVNLGTIWIATTDHATPVLHLRAIAQPREIRERLRQCVENVKQAKRIRQMESV